MVLCGVVLGVTLAYWFALPAVTRAAEPTDAPTYLECSDYLDVVPFTVPADSGDPGGDLNNWLASLAWTEPTPASSQQTFLSLIAHNAMRTCQKNSYYSWHLLNRLNNLISMTGQVRTAVQTSATQNTTANTHLAAISTNTAGGGGVTPAAAIGQMEETLMFMAGLLVALIMSFPIYRTVMP